MTDEVFSDNLDEASKADTEAAAAVEALPAEGEAVQAVAADQATDEQAQSEQDAPEEQTAETTEDEDTEQDAGAKAVEEFSKSLRTLEGKWYVLHTYSGYEKRVNLSFDEIELTQAIKPRLTAVRQQTSLIAASAVEHLTARMADLQKEGTVHLISTTLIERESVRSRN